MRCASCIERALEKVVTLVNATTCAQPYGDARRDRLALALVLFSFFAVNFSTASRLPYPWLDEIVYAEPAINLAFGHGFTSAAWHNSGSREVFAGNAPLYSLLLAGWVKVAGASQLAIRAFPLIIVACALVLLWKATRELRIISSVTWRVALAVVVICDYGFAFSYKGGRPEALAVLFCAFMLYSFTWRSVAHFSSLAIVALLLPFAGLQVFAFAMLANVVLLVCFRRRIVREICVVAVGLTVGLLLFYVIYLAFGIWPAFVRELQSQGSVNPLSRIGERLTANPLTIHHRAIPKDFSLAFLYLAVALTAFLIAKRTLTQMYSLTVLAVLFATVVPIGLYLGLAFSTYYSWMVCFPLAIAGNAIWSRWCGSGLRRTAIALQVAACVFGLPLQLAVAAYDWNERDPAPARTFVETAITPQDIVLCDWTAYYPAKAKAAKVYLPMYLKRIEPQEAASITVAVINSHPTPALYLTNEEQLEKLGGTWINTRASLQPRKPSLFGNDWQLGYLSVPNYSLEVYRRAKD